MNAEAQSKCPWCLGDPLYEKYHDEEWGIPVSEDPKQFEFLVLESAQAGLSWITILRKRENYRKAYDRFDPVKVSRYGCAEIERLLADPGIVRNRKKIEASVNNAGRFLEIVSKFGSFFAYLLGFVDGKPVMNAWKRLEEVPAHTPLSDRVAADLKKRGFGFLGSTIVYSHLQATGIVNDHLVSCFRWKELSQAGKV